MNIKTTTIFIWVFIILLVTYILKNNSVEGYTNVNEVAFRRYDKYNPMFYPGPMKECYLSTHYNGHVTRGFGNENWNSNRFVLVPLGHNLYLIKSKDQNMYLYTNPLKNYDINSNYPRTATPYHVWYIKPDKTGKTIIWNPKTKRFLALSCIDGNSYTRVNYTNDCIFNMLIP